MCADLFHSDSVYLYPFNYLRISGVSQSNTDGSERSTTGVRNLLHVFNEADDNNSDEEQFDETGMPS